MDKVEWLTAIDIDSQPRRRVRNFVVAAELPWSKGGQFTRLGRNGLGPKCELCDRTAVMVQVYKSVREDSKGGLHGWHVDPFDKDGVMLTLDHLIPVSWGGSDIKANLRTLCTKCNSRRGNMPTSEEICRVISAKDVVRDWLLFHQRCRSSKIVS